MYPVSVINFPSPEPGVLYISIVDIISKSVLVLFSLLCAINYRYNEVTVKVKFIKVKTSYTGLFLIVVLWSISQKKLSKLFLLLFLWDRTKQNLLCAIVDWPSMIIYIFLCFILTCHGTFIFPQKSNLWYPGYFLSQCFLSNQRIPWTSILINNNICVHQIPVIPTWWTLKYRTI